jgi:hypothetical protein
MCDTLTGYKKFWVGGPDMGLSLYDHEIVDFTVETTLMVIAWALLRRTPNAPRWATHPLTLIVLVLLQGAFDLAHRAPSFF